MARNVPFPEFEDPKLKALVNALEQRFNDERKLIYRFHYGAAATVSFSPEYDILLVSYTATGAVTVNLPLVTDMTGRLICIKDSGANAAANNITVDGAGSEEIDSATTYVMATNKQAAWFYSDGADWWVV